MKKIFAILLAVLALVALVRFDVISINDLGNIRQEVLEENGRQSIPEDIFQHEGKDYSDVIDKDGSYFSKDEVALYIHTYGCLPDNFITKDRARDLGWEGGSVEEYAPGYAIGGDRFGNREGQLPKGHTYYECDIDTDGYHSRGSRRIVFSDDGLIYYTHDHYETFELLYGEE